MYTEGRKECPLTRDGDGKQPGGFNTEVHTSQFNASSKGSLVPLRVKDLTLPHTHHIFNFKSFQALSWIDSYLERFKWHGINFFHLIQGLKWSQAATDDLP